MVCNMCMEIVEVIRREIKKSKKTRYQIARDTGICQSRLCRMMQGENINCEHAGALLEYFGYKLNKQKDR